MTRRALLLCFLVAAPLAAADANRAVEIALANALHSGDVKAAMQLFDPEMRGYAQIRAGVEQLVHDTELALEIDTASGIWTLEITSRDLAAGITHRRAKVSLRLSDGRIESLEPADFLDLPHGSGAWDAVFAFAGALGNEAAPPPMDQFDRSMPGYQEIKTAVTALWTRYRIDASLDLLSNEGDDAHRTLRIDWSLTLMNPQDAVDSARREETVECRLEKQGKTWRIVSFAPAGLFALRQ